MGFTHIARFEFRYQLGQRLFWSVFALFFLLTFGATTLDQIQVGSGANVFKNSPYAIAEMHLVWTVFFLFVTTAFVANVIVRDDDTGFGPIVRSTPVRKAAYLYGRFTGAFGAAALCFVSVPLAIALGSLMPWIDPETLGPNRLGHFAYAYFFLALPGLFVSAAVFFALATAVRSMMATYLGVLAFFVAYVVMNVALREPGHETLVSLADPFGLAAFGVATKYWPAADRNTLVPAIGGLLLYNRLLWIGIATIALGAAHVLFRFEERPRRRRVRETNSTAKPKAERTQGGASLARSASEEGGPALAGPISSHARSGRASHEAESSRPAPRPLPAPRFDAAASLAQLLARTAFEARQVLRSPAFLVLLTLAVVNGGTALWHAHELDGMGIHPVTRRMIDTLFRSFSLFPVIVAAYYAGELVWRERDARFHEIADATGASDWAFLLPKVFALVAVLSAMLLVGTATAVAVQSLQGYTHFEPGKYLLWYVLPGAVDWALLAVLAVFLQVVAPNKPAGWGLMVLYIVSTMVLAQLGFEHALYHYGDGPPVPLSDMNGTGDFAAAANWLRAYWSAFAVLLVVAARLAWPRGARPALGRVLVVARRRFVGPVRLVAAAACALLFGTGAYTFVNTNVWNAYATVEERDRRLADMEKALLPYEKVPQPAVTDVKLALDLHPHEPRLVTIGTYLLENRTDAPLAEAHVQWNDDLDMQQLAIEGARVEQDFARFAYRIYRFDTPMQPGEKRTLSFRSVLAQRGFKNRGNTTRLVDNGTFVNHAEFAPILGMDRSGLLQDRVKRRKYGLPAELRPARLEDEGARARNYLHADWVNADITVTTDADQTPIAPGYLASDETHEGRRTARFVTDAPVLHFLSVQSARYAVKRETYRGVDLAVFHDPQHTFNVDRMLAAMKLSLDTFQEAFGPYQFRQARIVEFPAYASFAQAFANTIPYSEGIGFIARLDDDPASIDYVSYVTAHELAHQWWAHQIVGADAQGATLLSETLAQYAALLVGERLHGPHGVRRFLKYELDAYLRSRSAEAVEEMPLVRVENQPYLHYRKGSLAMYLLKDRLGEAAVNRALRGLLARYRFRAAPWPTSQELVDALRAEAGPDDQQLITDLFERITLFDLRAEEAHVAERSDGRFDVVLKVNARKLYADGHGVETETPFATSDTVDVGLFAARPGEKGFGEEDVVRFERVAVRAGEQELRFTVDRRPAWAGIDPYDKQIDRDTDDNLVAVGN